jgi:large subunit ribosomal protein L2
MGKRLIPQRRGKGSSTYRAHGFRFAGKTSYNVYSKNDTVKGKIIDIIHSRGHSSPLLKVKYENGKMALIPSFIGAFVGQRIEINQKDKVEENEIKIGSAYTLRNLKPGTQIYNIEVTPGDSGKLVKAGGIFATVVSQIKGMTKITLPSKKEKMLNSKCRAFVGSTGGGGRLEKPFLKAGAKFHHMKKKNKLYPRTSGVAMSAYDHPHGSSRSLRKGRPTIAPKNAPPGRKVGMLRPKHTGRNK